MIESEIDRGIFVSLVEAERTAFLQLIDRYISEIAPKHKGAYSEIKRLEAVESHPLSTRIAATLTSSDFARYRDERLKIRKGNTVKREQCAPAQAPKRLQKPNRLFLADTVKNSRRRIPRQKSTRLRLKSEFWAEGSRGGCHVAACDRGVSAINIQAS